VYAARLSALIHAKISANPTDCVGWLSENGLSGRLNQSPTHGLWHRIFVRWQGGLMSEERRVHQVRNRTND